jgi:uncharacterized protein (DUF2147 family)
MKQVLNTSLFSIALLFFFAKGSAQISKPVSDKIIGIYWSPKKDAKIEMYKKADRYFGRTIWAANPGKDTKNPDLQLRKKDLLGLDLLTNFSYDDGVYTDGQVYDPESGKTYSCKISFSGYNLKIRGYIGISLFGRTEMFERIL